MTDKQIITLEGKSIIEYFERIVENKKLKDKLYAKEQECENVQSELIEANKQVIYLAKQLDQIKAENEILEAHSATLDAVIETGRVQHKALKQTLIEIQEMLKEVCMEECSFDWNKTSKKHCGDFDCRYGQILQKISEVIKD